MAAIPEISRRKRIPETESRRYRDTRSALSHAPISPCCGPKINIWKNAANAFWDSKKSWALFVFINPSSTQTLLEHEFFECVTTWRKETKGHSALGKKFLHPAYQRIVGMGEKALPLIFGELNRKPDHWFWALKYITGRDVAVDCKDFAEAREKWLKWGRERSLFNE